MLPGRSCRFVRRENTGSNIRGFFLKMTEILQNGSFFRIQMRTVAR